MFCKEKGEVLMDKFIDQYIYLVLTNETMKLEEILNRYIHGLPKEAIKMISGKTPLFLHTGMSARTASNELKDFIWTDLEKKGFKR